MLLINNHFTMLIDVNMFRLLVLLLLLLVAAADGAVVAAVVAILMCHKCNVVSKLHRLHV